MSAVNNGAAVARMAVATSGLGGLSGTSKKKRGGRKVGARGDLSHVVNSFIAGRAACGKASFPPSDSYKMVCQFETDGLTLKVHGGVIATRLSPLSGSSIAAKQIRVCFNPAGTRDMPYSSDKDTRKTPLSREFKDDQLAAVNLLMGAVKAGVKVHEMKDFSLGVRRIIRQHTLGPAILAQDSRHGECVIVEVTEDMRRKAVLNSVLDRHEQQLETLLSAYGFASKKNAGRKLSKQELNALAMQALLASEGPTASPVAAREAIQRLIKAMSTGRSPFTYP